MERQTGAGAGAGSDEAGKRLPDPTSNLSAPLPPLEMGYLAAGFVFLRVRADGSTPAGDARRLVGFENKVKAPHGPAGAKVRCLVGSI
jgi:hypothetical protein